MGATGELVSALGLGGHHIGPYEEQRDAIRLIHAAIDAGSRSWTTPGSITTAARKW